MIDGFGWWGILGASILLVGMVVVLFSLVFNYPIQFWPRWKKGPDAYRPLYPSSHMPDNLLLAVTEDMRTSMRVVWRTNRDVSDGRAWCEPVNGGTAIQADAACIPLTSDELTADKHIYCHSALLTGLEPGTRYRYRVGSPGSDLWSADGMFATEPVETGVFSFLYFADTQIRPRRFRELLVAADEHHPEAAFYMLGGDIVTKGEMRNLWDGFLFYTSERFSRKPVVPVMGNQDCGGERGRRIFNAYFHPLDLDEAAQADMHNFSFRYGNAFFITASRCYYEEQTPWLEEQLQKADSLGSTHRVVMMHYPVYNFRYGPTVPRSKDFWTPLFDRYRVDVVLTGHAHYYSRSEKMRGGEPVGAGEFGTTYLIANASVKHEKVEPAEVPAVSFTGVPTYQHVSIQPEGPRLSRLQVTSYTVAGKVVDRFESVQNL